MIPFHHAFKLKIFYQLFSVNPTTGKETKLTGKFGNTILTTGRQIMAEQNWFTAVHVGTSDTAPNAGQTSMIGFITATSTIEETTYGAQESAPFYGWRRRRFRCDVGTAAANLNEIGLGWSTNQNDCATRALIVDSEDIQVTVSPKADEYLDCVVEVRYYPPLVDVTGTIALGTPSVNYDYIVRAASVTAAAWGQFAGDRIAPYALDNTDWSAYDDDIGSIELGPSGVAYACDNNAQIEEPYADNSYELVFGMNGGPNAWNATTNKLLRSLRIKTTAGWYQIQLDSQDNPGFGLPKTTSRTLLTMFKIGWSEQII